MAILPLPRSTIGLSTLWQYGHNAPVYVANSQWEKYTADGVRKPGRALAAPVLLSVPLPH